MEDEIFINHINRVIKGTLDRQYQENVASNLLMMLFYSYCDAKIKKDPFEWGNC